MDGHEITELKLSALERTKRIDAEFYKKENIAVDTVLSAWNKRSIADCFHVSDGNHMSIADSFCEEGIPYYRGQDIYHLFIENSSPLMIDRITFDKPQMRRSHLQKGDILMSIVGAIVGNSAMVTSENPATCSCKLSIMRSKDNGIFPELLLIYIKTRYGQVQIQKFKRGAAQTGLLLEDFDQLFIPMFGDKFQKKIRRLVNQIYKCMQQAVLTYERAQDYIKSAIEFDAVVPNNTSSVKSLNDSFKTTGRLDAEYYQAKYDVYFSSLQRFETTRLPDEFDIFKNSGTDYAEGISDVGVIKTKQLTNSGVDTDGVESYFTNEVCAQNKSTFIANNDVIFASMGVGSLGKVSLFSFDDDKQFVTDSTLRIYRAKDTTRILPEVLCIFLQSTIGQELIYRYVVGSTGIINIYDDDIAKIPIPILDTELQKDIAAKVQESFALRRKSKQLLEYAKQAVEMAIEQGEEVALVWLKDKAEL
jgi:restriction endonuclease S subunit